MPATVESRLSASRWGSEGRSGDRRLPPSSAGVSV